MLFEILGNDSLIKEDSREKNKEEDLECDLLSKFRDLSLENKSLCQPERSTEVSICKSIIVFPFLLVLTLLFISLKPNNDNVNFCCRMLIFLICLWKY